MLSEPNGEKNGKTCKMLSPTLKLAFALNNCSVLEIWFSFVSVIGFGLAPLVPDVWPM